ncbi:MAG TPA: Sua5/YciO/YrdC/YwlC family protein [Solirubrobacteraceae bacterium]|nr:Sua5/YciO/YrdC/YwlC family protein [Solirubrobacteraceae bacterium]
MNDARAFERCLAEGGLALFPSDTVYGLACDPDRGDAVERLYSLKGRPLAKPSAVMFFSLEEAYAALPEVGYPTRRAMDRLLPGGVGLLLPNPAHRYPLACGEDPGTLGLRVPELDWAQGVRRPALQSSANLAGGPDPRRLEDVPETILQGVDVVIDGGELPGTASTVVDLRRYEEDGSWSVVRAGAVGEEELGRVLGDQYHFHPETYREDIQCGVPGYQRLQQELVLASGQDAREILELGTGTGETARRLLARHPSARLVGIDASQAMLSAARPGLPEGRTTLLVRRLEEPLPEGPFQLVASALCVHHLDPAAKSDLFTRVRQVVRPGGRFVLGDVVVPDDPSDARTPLTPGFDQPSPVTDQLRWLRQAGFQARVSWQDADLAVLVGEA